MCSEYPVVKERLLFGTDWHVLKRVPNYKNFKKNYIEVLSYENNFNESEIESFLGGNALKFLGLYHNDKTLKRLIKFYDKNNIQPPKWFQSIPQPDNVQPGYAT